MSFGNSRVRLLLGGAALATFTLLSVSCTSGSSDVAGTSAVSDASTTTLAPGTAPPTAAATAPPTTVVATVDPNALLQQGLAGLASGYHFRSSVVVNGTETLVAEGDRVADASRLTLISGGATVGYIITAAGSWAQPEGGEWEALDVSPATADPIFALSAPSAVGVLSDDGTTVRLRVTVPAPALGVGADGTADVEVVLTAGVIKEVDYTTAVQGGVASVATTLGPVADPTPITAPI
jgi:hypothetical protein